MGKTSHTQTAHAGKCVRTLRQSAVAETGRVWPKASERVWHWSRDLEVLTMWGPQAVGTACAKALRWEPAWRVKANMGGPGVIEVGKKVGALNASIWGFFWLWQRAEGHFGGGSLMGGRIIKLIQAAVQSRGLWGGTRGAEGKVGRPEVTRA